MSDYEPREPLINEHRLIEDLIYLLTKELRRVERDNELNLAVLDKIIDFILFYAHRCHHGKEEILFNTLKNKKLKSKDQETMELLISDHEYFQNTLQKIVNYREEFVRGTTEVLPEITGLLNELVELYPKHIKTEDDDFFEPVMNYLSDEEQEQLINEFKKFDMKLIHEKYQLLVKELKKNLE